MSRPRGWKKFEPQKYYGKNSDGTPRPSKRYRIFHAAMELLTGLDKEDLLPVGSRQVAYQLLELPDSLITKKDFSYVDDVLVLMRRAGHIPMHWISDGRAINESGYQFEDGPDVVATIKAVSMYCKLDLQYGQRTRVAVWLETQGVIETVQKVVDKYGCDLASSSGFDTLKVKVDKVEQYVNWIESGICDRVVIAHAGDCDENGLSIFNVLGEEIIGFGSSFADCIQLERVALTREQVKQFNLPEKAPEPDKRGQPKNRGIGLDVEVQLEALHPRKIVRLFEECIRSHLDLEQYQKAVERQADIRNTLIDTVADLRFPADTESDESPSDDE